MLDRKAYLQKIDEVIAQGPFSDNWESLKAFQPPQWLKDAKFGIFIHWGAYSVPAFENEWYPRNMYEQGSKAYKHHLETYGPHKDFGYKDFIPMFKAERFDAEEWADLFEKSGAKYVVPVAEHHDGFQMYHSELSHWNAYEMGPKRDVVGELFEACRKRGMTPGASSHRIEHWWFMGHGKDFDSDIQEPLTSADLYWPAMFEAFNQDLDSEPTPTQEFLEDWLLRCCEIIDRYQPQMLYFDWWIQHISAKPYLKKLAAYYYNRAREWGKEVTVAYKHDAYLFGTALLDLERGKFADIQPFFWQTDTAVAKNSWGYTENNAYKSARICICDLIDIVSKNGTLLLNVGPKSDGTIPQEDKNILLEIGRWLQVNGEAIYGTEVWRVPAEGPTQEPDGQFTDGQEVAYTPQDMRFTMKGSHLYVTVMRCPEEGKILVESLADQILTPPMLFRGVVKEVSLLGFPEGKLTWERDEEGLFLQLEGVQSDYPIVFKILLD